MNRFIQRQAVAAGGELVRQGIWRAGRHLAYEYGRASDKPSYRLRNFFGGAPPPMARYNVTRTAYSRRAPRRAPRRTSRRGTSRHRGRMAYRRNKRRTYRRRKY